jgi:hypothetical protein
MEKFIAVFALCGFHFFLRENITVIAIYALNRKETKEQERRI